MSSLSAPVPPRLWQTPKTVEIALTGACNLTCTYCSYGASRGTRRPEDMTTAQLLALLDELGECGVMRTILSGGEPLLRADFLEIVTAVVRNRMRFSVNTNGILLDEPLALALRDTRRLDNVQVSIDGADGEANARNRGRGAFEGAVRALRLLAALEMPRAVRLTLTRFTADQLESALDTLLELAPVVGTSEVMPFGRGATAYEQLAMTRVQRERSMAVLERYAAQHPGRISASAGPLASARNVAALREHLACGHDRGDDGSGHLSSCGGIHSTLAVLHDGTLVPCIQLPGFALGKVGSQRIAELWLAHDTLRELRERWSVPLAALDHCRGCEYLPFCRGGCPANAVAAYGTHLAPDPVHCLRRLIDETQSGGDGLVHRRGRRVHLRIA